MEGEQFVLGERRVPESQWRAEAQTVADAMEDEWDQLWMPSAEYWRNVVDSSEEEEEEVDVLIPINARPHSE